VAKKDISDIEQWSELARKAKFDVGLLSQELQVSQRQLQRYTRKLFGCAPQNWLNSERLQQAGQLLIRSQSVTDVSRQLGFKQLSHFSREFKLHFGLSPTGYLTWNKRPKTHKSPKLTV
jgi:AraC-like DNA-binding protein